MYRYKFTPLDKIAENNMCVCCDNVKYIIILWKEQGTYKVTYIQIKITLFLKSITSSRKIAHSQFFQNAYYLYILLNCCVFQLYKINTVLNYIYNIILSSKLKLLAVFVSTLAQCFGLELRNFYYYYYYYHYY